MLPHELHAMQIACCYRQGKIIHDHLPKMASLILKKIKLKNFTKANCEVPSLKDIDPPEMASDNKSQFLVKSWNSH